MRRGELSLYRQGDYAIPFEALTHREMEVFSLVAQGWANKQIADRLVLSVKTVKCHNSNTNTKLGLDSTGPEARLESVVEGLRRGIIEPPAVISVQWTEEHPAPKLTEREHEVLHLIAQGCSDEQIAERLTVSVKTAKTHVANILEELQVESRIGALWWGMKLGMVSPEVFGLPPRPKAPPKAAEVIFSAPAEVQ